MTSWPEQPPTGQPQAQTRRQAREFERSRRAGTSAPTPGGQIPEMTTSAPPRDEAPVQPDATDAQETAASEHEAPAASQNERPAIPASAFSEPGVSSPSRDSFELFRQGPDTSQPEPVTQPMTVLQGEAPAPASATSSERTLTRRELRAMQQAQQANAQANHPSPGEQIFPVAFTSGPEGGAEAPRAARPEPAETALPGAATAAPAVADTSEKSAWPFAPLTPSSAATPSNATPSNATPSAATPSAGPVGSRADQHETTVTQSSASPFAAFGATPARAESAPPVGTAAAEDAAVQERRPFTPPTGHWSTAAEFDDENQPVISRNVAQSTAATTTNALILPSIPKPSTSAPLTSTGEILVTGSIDLPRGMGATGAHPDRIDSSDIDRLLDGEENEFNTSEVQPVRASRAISTHTSTRGVIAPPKKRGNTLPIVLMVTAGVLAVGVIGLLVAAYVLKVF